MNISDLNNLNVNSNKKISIRMDKNNITEGEALGRILSLNETKDFFDRLVPLENNIFFDPEYEIYYCGNKSFDSSSNSTIFELYDVTEIYNKYKQAKQDCEINQLDFLTHLSSRNKLDSDLLGYLSHAVNNKHEFALLMCDIDLFKNVNDTYGHVFGDRVLAKIAEVLKSSIRTDELRRQDIIGRYGGEEFLIVLKDVTKEQSFLLAERIRKNIEKIDIDNIRVTISIGIFHSDDMLESGKKFVASKELLIGLRDQVIECADVALYRSKENGRNHSTIYDCSMSKRTEFQEDVSKYCLKKLPVIGKKRNIS